MPREGGREGERNLSPSNERNHCRHEDRLALLLMMEAARHIKQEPADSLLFSFNSVAKVAKNPEFLLERLKCKKTLAQLI